MLAEPLQLDLVREKGYYEIMTVCCAILGYEGCTFCKREACRKKLQRYQGQNDTQEASTEGDGKIT